MSVMNNQKQNYSTPKVEVLHLSTIDVLSFSYEVNGFDVFDDGFDPTQL